MSDLDFCQRYYKIIFYCADCFFLIIEFLYKINLIFFLRLVFWEHISVNHTGEFILCDYVCECERLEYVSFIIFSFQRPDPFKMHWFTVSFVEKCNVLVIKYA